MNDSFALHLDNHLCSLRAVVSSLPAVQVLPVMSKDALAFRLKKALEEGRVLDANRMFWTDQAVTFEAWTSITAFRLSEHIESSMHLKALGHFLAAAAVCRSALEAAVVALRISASASKVMNSLDVRSLTGGLCFSRTLPDDLDMALYGTRLKEKQALGSPTQKNVLTYLQQLSKHPMAGNLVKEYEYLCDLTHPNWLSNRPFYTTDPQGSIQIVSKEYDQSWAIATRQLLDVVTSWSAKATCNVAEQATKAITHARSVIGAA